jgi:hypothetical protein
MKMICRNVFGLVLADESESAQTMGQPQRAARKTFRFVTVAVRSLCSDLRCKSLWLSHQPHCINVRLIRNGEDK